MGVAAAKLLRSALVIASVVALAGSLLAISALLLVAFPILPRRVYARLAAFCQEQALTAFLFMIERNHTRLRVFLSGDPLPSDESALLVSNHVAAHGDWAPIYSLLARTGRAAGGGGGGLGAFKCVIKDVAKWVPGFGWGMWLLNWPFLKRNWAGDKPYLESKLRAYAEDGVPLQLLLFPEGTRWTPNKHADAVKYAEERKLHVPVHTMIPRYKGFHALVRGLDGVVTHVYDITLAYTGFKLKAGGKGPGFLGVFLHDLAPGAGECGFHVHVRRLELASLPKGDEELKAALFQWFADKDKLLDQFHQGDQRRFPGARQASPLPAGRWVPAVSLMALFLGVVLRAYTMATAQALA